jgi:hypothetical protein
VNSLDITIPATKNYCYAVLAQATTVRDSVLYYCNTKNIDKFILNIVIVSDGCEKMISLEKFYKKIFNKSCVDLSIQHIRLNINDEKPKYKKESQLLIAKMRQTAFDQSKKNNSDYCLSLDSDILIKTNTLNVLEDIISFDNGYYSISMCPYPSNGIGPLMGGHGSYNNKIYNNFFRDEKVVSPKIKKRISSYFSEKRKIIKKKIKSDEDLKRISLLSKKIYLLNRFIDLKTPVKDNIYGLNSKRWRKRGWLDYAYPSIGKGSIVPTDWTGFGCTLISKKALYEINFNGYDGGGTEDLFIVWEKWFPKRFLIGCAPHCPVDHIVRKNPHKSINNNEYIHIVCYHEEDDEYKGHIRQNIKEFIDLSIEELNEY